MKRLLVLFLFFGLGSPVKAFLGATEQEKNTCRYKASGERNEFSAKQTYKNCLKNLKEQNKNKLAEEKIHIKKATWRNRTLRFSFEEIDMPDAGEHMGLYGIGAYDRLNPWLYGGITAYGAASGRRGGFFTGGYTLGVERQLIDNLILDAGGYVGAGGGGSAAQGGGLMIRPHIGLKYDLSWAELGLKYSYVESPHGDISRDALALSLDKTLS